MVSLVLLVSLFLTLVVFFFALTMLVIDQKAKLRKKERKENLSLQNSFESATHTVQAHVSLTISSCSNPNFACTYWIASIHPFFCKLLQLVQPLAA